MEKIKSETNKGTSPTEKVESATEKIKSAIEKVKSKMKKGTFTTKLIESEPDFPQSEAFLSASEADSVRAVKEFLKPNLKVRAG